MTNEKLRIEIPKTFMGISTEEAYKRVLEGNPIEPETQRQTFSGRANIDGMIHIPTIDIYFAKERSYLGKNWNEAHPLLATEGKRMPTIPEFIQSLKYLQSSSDNELQELYKEITEVREPWRANWLDADFKVVNGVLHINYNHRIQNGILTPRNSEPLVKETVMENKSKISLENWLANATPQGLPNQNLGNGQFYYWAPLSDNNSVARFYANSDRADLNCSRYPDYRSSILGVFGVINGGS